MRAKKDRRPEPREHAEDVASMTECTGLIPALPLDDDGADSAAALYAIHSAKPAEPEFPTK